jgi:hypothetical protein
MEIFGLAMSTSAIVVALAVALGFCSTGVGAIIGAAIAAVSILFSWVTKYINAPDLEFVNADCRTYFPDSTIINMRRNGGLERSDQFVYYLKVRNTGKNRVWMRARLRMAGDTLLGGWTSWLGDWADGKNRDGYKEDEVFSQYFVASIDDATPNLKYELQFEADWRHWYAFVPVREDLMDQEWLVPMNMHALENSISEFYAFTSDYGSVSELKHQYEEALEEYRYWDACNIGETIIKAAEVNSGINLSYFNHLEVNSNVATVIVPMVMVYNVYKYQTSSLWEWEHLLTNFYAQRGVGGWAAWDRPDDPTYSPPTDWGSGMLAPRTRSQPDTFEWNMMSYDESNGILYTTADPIMGEQWMENKRLELSDAYIYRELIDNLPIKSNLSTDLRKQRIEVDPVSGIAEVHLTMNIDPWHNPYYTTTYPFFPFILIGRDGDKIVEFQITAPEGYSIGPQSVFTDYLLSTISFNLSTDTPKLGVYFFNISVFFEGDLIFKESVPFKVGGFSCMEFEYFTPTDPIVPGQMFTLVDMYNLGTFTEILNVTTDGFPEDFIYSDIYPIGFIENCAFVALNPGEAMPGLIIKPPRHYTTIPGIYSYKFRARDNVSNNYDEIMEGIFEVAEFYDLSLICADSEISIFDNEVAVYNFILTNLGNVGQEFNISVDDIPFAEKSLSHESIYLGPGESQSFTLNLTPIGWGEQVFSINVTSEYNSSLINAKIIVMDDDVNSPLFTNFEIINTTIDVTVNFEVLNEFEGDDYGLSMIRIFIDDELVLNYAPPAIETNFSFTFDSSHGDWFMENGTHEIRVEIFDNDFDVLEDSLYSTISGTFETTLLNMYCYVDWQLETLKSFIDNKIDSCFIRSWNCMLSMAQWQLEKAFDYVYNGSITCGLFHDAVAKVLVQIVNFKTEIFEKLNKIDKYSAEVIINSTYVIRDIRYSG